MAEISVIEVESSAQLKQFIAYPDKLYADEPNYVAPLHTERKEFFDKNLNPFFKTARTKLFLAFLNGAVVGRIATCISFRHNEYYLEKTGFFGFFDCPDDQDISRKLLKVAMITLKSAGMERMRGPMNFSTNHECGFLIDGFDSPPMVMMPYNQAHQPKLAEAFGLKKIMDLLAFRLDPKMEPTDRIKSVVERKSKKSDVKIRGIKMSDFANEVQLIRDVYNSAWADNWGFIPMDEAEFTTLAKNLKQIVDPNIVCIAEHNGKPIGFSLAIPNINQALIHLNGKLLPFGLLKLLWHTKIKNKVDSCRLITFGVIPEYRKRAVDMMLYLDTIRRGRESGYQWGELSWVLETNDLMRAGVEQMGAVLYKTYRIMEMPL